MMALSYCLQICRNLKENLDTDTHAIAVPVKRRLNGLHSLIVPLRRTRNLPHKTGMVSRSGMSGAKQTGVL